MSLMQRWTKQETPAGKTQRIAAARIKARRLGDTQSIPEECLELDIIMNLWLRGHFLFAVLFVSSSALTAEECEPLIRPLSMADPSLLHGRTHLLVGYTDNDIFKAILNHTHSSWLNITAGEDGGLVITEANNMNGTCIGSKTNLTIEDDMARGLFADIQTGFHILPTCEGCLVFSVNSTADDIKKILEVFRVENPSDSHEFKARSVYLLGNKTTVKDSDMEYFKKQASCLGFHGEPDWTYNPDKEFCKEGETVLHLN
ncbi:uncharacterized protein LOC111583854 [Amphiprion ocellaris]|uniref:Uncharacterized protein n=1 Tax=Amphiprion ocellaris TaxID=80972 RepID=A0A3Q1C2I7_AMPOC|nr:uncharacterized protein LOC111583854 [Amphiprion ocellaris]